MQTVIAPVITSMLFLMVFAVAVGDQAQLAGDVRHRLSGAGAGHDDRIAERLCEQLLLAGGVQGAEQYCRSSDAAHWARLLFGLAAGGMTRGIAVEDAALVLGVFGGLPLGCPAHGAGLPVAQVIGDGFRRGAAGVWSNKFDEVAAITSFIIQPLAFLSGTFYSVDRLPAPDTSPR